MTKLTIMIALTLLSGVAAAAPKVTIGSAGEDLEKAKAAGFDYVEVGVRNFARLDDAKWTEYQAKHKAVGIPTPVANNFIPSELKVVGPEVDKAKQDEYVAKAFDRAKVLGIKTIVFGSGGARKVPDGFSQDEAWKQLVEFAKRIAPQAKKRGIVVAVEPLQKGETNTINTAAEGLKWVKAVNHPNFQLMVDFYHLSLEKRGSGDPGEREEEHQAHPHRQPGRAAVPDERRRVRLLEVLRRAEEGRLQGRRQRRGPVPGLCHRGAQGGRLPARRHDRRGEAPVRSDPGGVPRRRWRRQAGHADQHRARAAGRSARRRSRAHARPGQVASAPTQAPRQPMPASPLPPPAARTRVEQAVRVFASLALLALVGTYVAAQVDFVRRHHPGVAPARYWLPQLSQIWAAGAGRRRRAGRGGVRP